MEYSLESIRTELLSLADPQYREFQKKLLPGTDNLIGVRLPVLRKLAWKIAGEWGEGYLEACLSFRLVSTGDLAEALEKEFFEEVMLQGMVIGYLGTDRRRIKKSSAESDGAQLSRARGGAVLMRYAEQFLPKIDNWSVCDSFCSSFKYAANHQEEIWTWLNALLVSDEEFTIRFVIVMLLNYYINDAYIDALYPIFDEIRHEGYYVKMAAAWAVSICYMKYPEKTERYLNDNRLDDFTYRKALCKIIESRCISAKEKEKIRRMKR